MENLKEMWGNGLREVFYSLGGTAIFLICAYLYATAPIVDEFAISMSLLLAFCCFTVTLAEVIFATVKKIKNRK